MLSHAIPLGRCLRPLEVADKTSAPAMSTPENPSGSAE